MSRLLNTYDPSFIRILNSGTRIFHTSSRNEMCYPSFEAKHTHCRRPPPLSQMGRVTTGARTNQSGSGWNVIRGCPQKFPTDTFGTQHTLPYLVSHGGNLKPSAVYDAEAACHISAENIQEIEEKMNNINSLGEFCAYYDQARSHYKQQTALLPREERLYPNLFQTDLSTYVRNFDAVDTCRDGAGEEASKERVSDSMPLFELCLETMMKQTILYMASCAAGHVSSETGHVSSADSKYHVCDSKVNKWTDSVNFANELLGNNRPDSSSNNISFEKCWNMSSAPDPFDVKFNSVSWCEGQGSEGERTHNLAGDSDKPSREELEEIADHFCIEWQLLVMEHRHDYRMYHPNLIFQNNWSRKPYTTQGVNAYCMQLIKARVWMNCKFKTCTMKILSCVVNPNNATIKIRWRLTAMPVRTMVKNAVKFTFRKLTLKELLDKEAREDEWYDGISILHINNDVLIWKHVVEKFEKDEEKAIVKDTVKKKVAAVLGLAAPVDQTI